MNTEAAMTNIRTAMLNITILIKPLPGFLNAFLNVMQPANIFIKPTDHPSINGNKYSL